MKKCFCLMLSAVLITGNGLFANSSSLSNLSSPPPYSDKTSPRFQKKDDSFNYMTVGAAIPIPVPKFTLGQRQKFNNDAIDVSVGFATAIIASSVSADWKYLKYVGEKQFYIGGGAGVSMGFFPVDPYIIFGVGPSVSVGKENEKSFHQINAAPIHFSNQGISIYPYVTYQYGFKF